MKSKWEKHYFCKGVSIRTGKVTPAYKYECTCCGWKTGEQATKYIFCPMCGDKKKEERKNDYQQETP